MSSTTASTHLTVIDGGPATADVRPGQTRGRAQAQLAGVISVFSALLQGVALPDVLTLVAGCAQRTTAARWVLVATSTPSGGFLVEAAAGVGAQRLTGSHRRISPTDPADGSGAAPSARALWTVPPGADEPGHTLSLPMGRDSSGQDRVLLVLADTRAALARDELALADFAGQVATSLALAQQRRQADEDAAVGERDALASDLLEQLLLPLYQVSSELAAADGLIGHQPVAARARLWHGIQALDQIISRSRRVVCSPRPLTASTSSG